jgi:S1-C subfamily serine protease
VSIRAVFSKGVHLRVRPGRVAAFCLVLLLLVALPSCTNGGSGTTRIGGATTTVAGGVAGGDSDLIADEASPAQQVLNAVYDSLVNIAVTANVGGQNGTGIGSGVVYSSDGYVLTNDHVVGAENIGFSIPADVIASVAKTLTGR